MVVDTSAQTADAVDTCKDATLEEQAQRHVTAVAVSLPSGVSTRSLRLPTSGVGTMLLKGGTAVLHGCFNAVLSKV